MRLLSRRLGEKGMTRIQQISVGRALCLIPIVISVLMLSRPAWAVPSYARQTGLGCDSCHTSYPGLTSLGREFKADGYTMSGLTQMQKVESKPNQSAPGMNINRIPNLSVILQADEEYLAKQADPTSNTNHFKATFPKELGLYYAGRITEHMGTFLQVTYAQGDGFSMDMSDLRYVRDFSLGGHRTILGLDVNNGPTLEDLWNSTPDYGWPYVEGGPRPMPFIAADSVMTNVVGAGSYLYWDNLLYGYAGVYQSAPQGGNDALHGISPYVRLAYTPTPNLEVGAFGFFATRPCYTRVDPSADSPLAPSPDVRAGCGSGGSVDDLGLDAQYQMFAGANNVYTFHARAIREIETGAEKTFGSYGGPGSISRDYLNADANWIYEHRWALSGGVFGEWGKASNYYNLVYGSGFRPVSTPDTFGEVVEGDYFPWENVKLSLQYTYYNMVNGYASDYNGAGRDASDDNLFVVNALWGF